MAGCCAHFCFYFAIVCFFVNGYFSLVAKYQPALFKIATNEENGPQYQDNAVWSLMAASAFYFVVAIVLFFIKDREAKKEITVTEYELAQTEA